MAELASRIIGLFIAFVILILGPFLNQVVTDDNIARVKCIDLVGDFVDEVSDSRVITEEEVTNLQLSLAETGANVSISIERYQRVINPEPGVPGGTQKSLVLVKNNKSYLSGDYVSVRIQSVGHTVGQKMLLTFTNLLLDDFDYTIPRRVD